MSAVDINIKDSRMKPVKIERRLHIDGAVSVFDAIAVRQKYHKEIGRLLLNEKLSAAAEGKENSA